MDACVLDGRFVRLRRSFVISGQWGSLSRADRTGGVTAAPVMAVLSCGYPEGTVCLLNRLAGLSGTSKADLQRARGRLESAGAIEFLPGPRRGVWRFRSGPGLVGSERGESFRFPGVLVADHTWAVLTPAERALVLTLAALARGAIVGEGYPRGDGTAGWLSPETVEGFEEDDDVLGWLDEIGAGEPDKFGGLCIARRVGHTSTTELAGLAGLPNTEAASRVLHQLEDQWDYQLVTTYRDSHRGGVWYHLPAAIWRPPLKEEW